MCVRVLFCVVEAVVTDALISRTASSLADFLPIGKYSSQDDDRRKTEDEWKLYLCRARVHARAVLALCFSLVVYANVRATHHMCIA